MNIQFAEEGDTLFIIAENVFYRGKMCDELLFGEITPYQDHCIIKWEDSWQKPENVPGDIETAKTHVLATYKQHTPYVNGRSYDID